MQEPPLNWYSGKQREFIKVKARRSETVAGGLDISIKPVVQQTLGQAREVIEQLEPEGASRALQWHLLQQDELRRTMEPISDALRRQLPGPMQEIAQDGADAAADLVDAARPTPRLRSPQSLMGGVRLPRSKGSLLEQLTPGADGVSPYAASLAKYLGNTVATLITGDMPTDRIVTQVLPSRTVKGATQIYLQNRSTGAGMWTRVRGTVRTAVGQAQSMGEKEAWAEMVDGSVPFMWTAVMEAGKTCEFCSSWHGEIRNTAEEFPSIPAHPSCFCSLLPVAGLEGLAGGSLIDAVVGSVN